MKIAEPYLIKFDPIGSPDLGYISVSEFPKNIPFEVKRTYWTYYTPHHVVRGNHGHKELQQVIVAVSGIIDFELENTEGQRFDFRLENPEQGLFIPAGFWRIIKFSHNAVLLCMASLPFDADDYIRDYDEFKKL